MYAKGWSRAGSRYLRDAAPVWVAEGAVVAPVEEPVGVVVFVGVPLVQLANGHVRLVCSCRVEYAEGVVYVIRSMSKTQSNFNLSISSYTTLDVTVAYQDKVSLVLQYLRQSYYAHPKGFHQQRNVILLTSRNISCWYHYILIYRPEY